MNPQAWRRLAGRWTIEATHPGLPGAAITGQSEFEWLDSQRLLLQRSHFDHPEIPAAFSVSGIVDGEPAMHYFDVRGVHRVFGVEITETTWRWWNDAPGFALRFTGELNDDVTAIDGQAEHSQDDGATWEPDLAMTYRRIA